MKLCHFFFVLCERDEFGKVNKMFGVVVDGVVFLFFFDRISFDTISCLSSPIKYASLQNSDLQQS